MSSTLQVSNLASTTSTDELRELFAAHGEVRSVSMAFDALTRQNGGFAHVVMADAADALACIAQLHGRNVQGRALHVEAAQKRIVQAPAARLGSKSGAISGARERRQKAFEDLERLFSRP